VFPGKKKQKKLKITQREQLFDFLTLRTISRYAEHRPFQDEEHRCSLLIVVFVYYAVFVN